MGFPCGVCNTYWLLFVLIPHGRFFNYFDIFADEFTARGIGFCSYSQRGVRDGDTPPFFVEIDEQAYQQYRPSVSVAGRAPSPDGLRRQMGSILWSRPQTRNPCC